MLYLDNQAIDVIRHATEAFLESFDGEPDAPYTPEAGQVLEELERVLMAEFRVAADDQTTPASELVDDLCWELKRFDFFDNCDLTYLIYTRDIEEFFVDNTDEVEEAIGDFGGVEELAGECDTISDMISRGVYCAQYNRAMSASSYYADKSDGLREWLENELAEQYGHGWDEEEEEEDEN